MLKLICWWLAVLGGLNWGLVGIFSFNAVEALVTGSVARIIYAVVGVASAYLIFSGIKKK